MRFPLGEMTVGDILDRGLKLLFARLPTFYAINLIVLTPVILLQIAAPFVVHSGRPLDPAAMYATLGVGLFALLLTLILQPIGTAAILHIIMEEYVGNRVTIGQAFSYALGRFLPLVGASILVGLIVIVGLLLCCIPGIIFGVFFAFVSQVVVLEKLGASDALTRSWKLVSGYWGRVFGVLLLVGVANFIVQAGLGAALGLALPSQEVIPAEDGPRIEFNPVNHVVDTLVTQLVSILFTTYIAICTTLLYLDIRIRKEGFDLELAALGEGGPRDEYDDRDRDRDDEYEDGYDDRDRDRYDDRDDHDERHDRR